MLQLAALIPVIGEVLDRVIPDKNAAERAKNELSGRVLDIAAQGNLAQAEINKTEAASSNLFVAGWRPFIGWVCGLGLFWAYLGQPVAAWSVAAFGLKVASLPVIPTDSLLELVLAMLGLAGLRTFEKKAGKA